MEFRVTPKLSLTQREWDILEAAFGCELDRAEMQYRLALMVRTLYDMSLRTLLEEHFDVQEVEALIIKIRYVLAEIGKGVQQ